MSQKVFGVRRDLGDGKPLDRNKVADILEEIRQEKERQYSKYGNQRLSPLEWYATLGEEYGEVGRALWEQDKKGYRKELVQVAAVCLSAVMCIDAGVETDEPPIPMMPNTCYRAYNPSGYHTHKGVAPWDYDDSTKTVELTWNEFQRLEDSHGYYAGYEP